MKRIRLILIGYILMIPVIFILPFFSFNSYSILKNTTSHLAAQHAPNGWIMNVVFVLLGVTTIIEGWVNLKKYLFHKIIITIFGISLILTAVYQHAPIELKISFNVFDDEMHSLFASLCGWSFVMSAVSCSFIEKNIKSKIFALASGMLALILSVLMFSVTDLMGIWQRIIFILSFGWLVYFFEGRRLLNTNEGN